MAFLRVEDHMIRYELVGEKNPVALVFVNGLTQAAHLWGPYVPRFVEKGYCVLTFDMLGQGESDKPVLSFDFDRQARTMSALIKRLGIERPFIAGISFGGAVALRYAILYPDQLRGLVAMGAFSELDGRLKWIGENLYMGLAAVGTEYIQNWFMPFNFSSKWLEENATAIPMMRRRGYTLNDQYALQNLMESVARCSSFSHELPNIQVPTLILNGEYDYITHRGLQNILRAGIVRSRLVIIQHASHAFTLEYPEVSIRLIGDFMEKVMKDEWPGDQTTWVANDDPMGEPLYLPVLGDPSRAIQPGPVSGESSKKTMKERKPAGVKSKNPNNGSKEDEV